MGEAQTITVTVTPEMKALIEERIATGEFATPSELVRTAIRGWLRAESECDALLAELRAEADAAAEGQGESTEQARTAVDEARRLDRLRAELMAARRSGPGLSVDEARALFERSQARYLSGRPDGAA